MAMASYEILLVMMLVVLMRVAAGEVYKVGDSSGWTNVGYLDYKNWASSKTFRVGDTIKFEYNKEFQNVVRVTHKNFRTCNATAPYATLATGADSFPIRRTGHYYFICSLPGHCEAGQKVDIRVPATAAPPKSPLPPITPLPFPPSPAPLSVPVPSPAPSSVPVPTPVPSSVPVPSPAPASVPVPLPAPASVPSPAPSSVPVPSPAPPLVPVPSPSAPPSVPLQPPSQPPSPPSDFAPAPSPRKNGSGKGSVKNWLTLMAIVLGFTF